MLSRFSTDQIKIGAGILGVIATAGIIYAGYGTKSMQVDRCAATVTKYVTAEYSETTSGIDYEGDYYSDTDYWSERASERASITMINEPAVYPDMPHHDVSMKRDRHFDRFQFHTDTKLKVLASTYAAGSTTFEEPINKTNQCLSRLGDDIQVKTWFGISYGSDF